MEVATFTCSICSEASHDICVYCTKDACANHLCERCQRCSDCCQCEVALLEVRENAAAKNGHFYTANGHIPDSPILEQTHELTSDDEIDDIEEPDEELEGNPE
jgi:hypothetical protein